MIFSQNCAKVLLTMFVGSLFFGCGESAEDRAISEAQDCLDHSTQSNATTCLSFIDGVTTKESYIIRCSVHYIEQGFGNPEKLSNAYEAMKSSSESGGSSTLAMIGQLAFNDLGKARTASSDCKLSENASMITFSSLTVIATNLSVAAASIDAAYQTGGAMTEEQATAAIQTLADGSSDAELGAAVVAAEGAYCKEGTSNAESQACQDLEAALGNGTSMESIGQQLRCQLTKTCS